MKVGVPLQRDAWTFTCSIAHHGNTPPSFSKRLLLSTSKFASRLALHFLLKILTPTACGNAFHIEVFNMARFTNLPPELRNTVFDNLLTSEGRLQHLDQYTLAMFTVSKRLHEESSSYFYQHNAIVVDVPSAATDTATVLPPIADKYLCFLKQLTVQTFVSHATLHRTHKTAAALVALSCIGANFDELNVLIKSPLSHILNSRVDDSTLHSAHPITLAIRKVLESKVTKTFRIQLQDAWFAPGVARVLQADFGSRVEFYRNETHTQDAQSLERSLTGRYSSTHLTNLDLDMDNAMDTSNDEDSASPISTPSTSRSSLGSPFVDLDTFSISSFGMGSNDCEKEDLYVSVANHDTSEAPFFTEDDIEEWSASTEEQHGIDEGDDLEDLEDLDGDDEMEDVEQEDIDAIMRNMEAIADHVANEDDVTYMANFAPDLLLSRHHLDHLV
jgi:hypothetical protein